MRKFKNKQIPRCSLCDSLTTTTPLLCLDEFRLCQVCFHLRDRVGEPLVYQLRISREPALVVAQGALDLASVTYSAGQQTS